MHICTMFEFFLTEIHVYDKKRHLRCVSKPEIII